MVWADRTAGAAGAGPDGPTRGRDRASMGWSPSRDTWSGGYEQRAPDCGPDGGRVPLRRDTVPDGEVHGPDHGWQGTPMAQTEDGPARVSRAGWQSPGTGGTGAAQVVRRMWASRRTTRKTVRRPAHHGQISTGRRLRRHRPRRYGSPDVTRATRGAVTCAHPRTPTSSGTGRPAWRAGPPGWRSGPAAGAGRATAHAGPADPSVDRPAYPGPRPPGPGHARDAARRTTGPRRDRQLRGFSWPAA